MAQKENLSDWWPEVDGCLEIVQYAQLVKMKNMTHEDRIRRSYIFDLVDELRGDLYELIVNGPDPDPSE